MLGPRELEAATGDSLSRSADLYRLLVLAEGRRHLVAGVELPRPHRGVDGDQGVWSAVPLSLWLSCPTLKAFQSPADTSLSILRLR